MRMPADMLFVPSWLEDIQPMNPRADEFRVIAPDNPVYSLSWLTAHIITPASLHARSTGRQDGQWPGGHAFCSGTIIDAATRSHEAQAGRSARKARRAAEMGNGTARRTAEAKAGRRADRAGKSDDAKAVARMEVQQAARLAREEAAEREERRAQCAKAFAAFSPCAVCGDTREGDGWECPGCGSV
jgi:hypothetical protein